jgi:peptidyl-prolyl cis-trans isomerase C
LSGWPNFAGRYRALKAAKCCQKTIDDPKQGVIMFSSFATHRTAKPRRLGTTSLLILSGALLIAMLAAGCGGGDKSENAADEAIVIAKVGNAEITDQYYEDRLALLEEKELPSENGVPLDMAAFEGKSAFLNILINKELMNQKARQLGYDKDPKIVQVRRTMENYEGGLLMWDEAVEEVANTITEDELQEYYKMMGIVYRCQYIICNFEDDALEAREYALTGADWKDVTSKFHDGLIPENGILELKVPYGQYSPDFEDLVFATELNGVSQPISSTYGFWVVKPIMIHHGEKPDLEESKAHILDVTRNRKIGKTRLEFQQSVRDAYEFTINEDALWAAFQGLPDMGLMDPETQQPYTKDQLLPLDLKNEDLGLVLYSYREPGKELFEMVLGDYKTHFDNMSVFQRPRTTEMLGGFRQKLISEVERSIMALETERRGYYDRPEVQLKVKKKIEEMIVTDLYNEVITFDDKITPEQLDEFWAAHKDEYKVPESRSGQLVICLTREKADSARQAILNGMEWSQVLVEFGSDKANKSVGGKLQPVAKNSDSIVREPLFALEVGDTSEPFAIADGRYALVKLLEILPPREYTLNEANESIGKRMRAQRQEEAFAQFLALWTEEFGVEVFTDNLAGLKSWQEIHAYEEPENVVPRN